MASKAAEAPPIATVVFLSRGFFMYMAAAMGATGKRQPNVTPRAAEGDSARPATPSLTALPTAAPTSGP